jgi:NOL1/NOP2/fmu family ribosome biogenesis protein
VTENRPDVFERLPATDDERAVEGRPTREAVVDFWTGRYGLPLDTFEGHTFWEKGAGKVWAFAADLPAPADVEALGMTFLRTRQEHWKPTTDAVQRFGRGATRNVVTLDREGARRFLAGETQELPDWGGDWGYLIAAHEIAGDLEPIGVGLYLHGELRSQVPKGRRREL